jgi:hypothetical protein
MITSLNSLHPDVEDASELPDTVEEWTKDLVGFRQQLADLGADATALQRAAIELEIADRQARLEDGAQAWRTARPLFDLFLAAEDWNRLAESCDVLFRAEQPESTIALGHGIWIGVTFPIDPVITVVMMQHLVDSSPSDSNTAAVAATVAHYIAAIRGGEGQEGEDLVDFTEQLLLLVAGNQGISGQQDFAGWMHHNGLKEPEEFIPRLSEGVDNLVGDSWWFDRDELRAHIPADA